MHTVTPFEFHGKKVRLVTDDSNRELFVAKDVAVLLGYADTTQAVRKHCKKTTNVRGVKLTPLGGNESLPPILDPQTKLIPESDVWRLVIKSTLPEAEKIEEWIMEEVLPSIRKTGTYSVHKEPQPQNDQFILGMMMSMMENQQRQTDAMIELTGSVVKMVENLSRPAIPSRSESNKITPDQKRRLREAIDDRAQQIAGETGMSRKSIVPGIWAEFKHFHDLREYTDLDQNRFSSAMNWVMMYEPRDREFRMPAGIVEIL
jgi:prophage antirepressor-like protein